MDEKQIWKELKKYGIHNEKELDEAISKTALNISCFVTKPTIYKKIKCDTTHKFKNMKDLEKVEIINN